MDFETVSCAMQMGFGLASGVMMFWCFFKLLSAVIELAVEVIFNALSSCVRGVGWCVKQVLQRLRARK